MEKRKALYKERSQKKKKKKKKEITKFDESIRLLVSVSLLVSFLINLIPFLYYFVTFDVYLMAV